MFTEKIDFYSPVNLKSYNLDQIMRYQLDVLGNLDYFTRKHSENVANLVCRLCEYLHAPQSFTIYCTICAYLHDIGKLFIPAQILQKPTQLTEEEFEVMKKHTTLGYEMCMKDPKLRLYAPGPLYHHEALNGSGYPQGLTKRDIPYEAQIIRIADEYDALVTKRQYKTHVNISETLKDLIKDSNPDPKFVALDHLSEIAKIGKIDKKILRTFFKVIIDDIEYEISAVIGYVNYLEEQIKRLELINNYKTKMEKSNKEKTKSYYLEGIKLLLNPDETLDNYQNVLQEYKDALVMRKDRIQKLHEEIKIIKKLKI